MDEVTPTRSRLCKHQLKEHERKRAQRQVKRGARAPCG
jgi:predicted membrane GTPase involved in stress response